MNNMLENLCEKIADAIQEAFKENIILLRSHNPKTDSFIYS